MNEHLGEDAELYALGVLDAEESARVEAHAARCAGCSRRLGAAERVVAALAEGVPVAPPRAAVSGPRRPAASLAAAAAFVVLLGATLASLVQTSTLRARLGADDAVLATLATSHFNHDNFVKAVPGAPTAKELNGRRGEWLYVIVDAPASGLRLVGERGGTAVDLGTIAPHGATSTLFVRAPGRVTRLELRRDGTTLETVTPSYDSP